MKSILLIPLLFVTLYFKSQNNDLNPNAKWNCWDLDGTTQCKDTYKYNLYFNGDSIINGNQYFKMYKVGYKYYSMPSGTCNAPNTFFHYYNGLVRYHQNKLIYYNGISDVIFIDYNLQIGDTIKNVMFNNSSSNHLKITRIDSVNVNGNYLNRFFYQSSVTADTGYVIEKIGSNHGFLSEFTSFFESSKELICYSENNVTVYNNTGIIHSSCDITLNLKSNTQVTLPIDIFPNPIINEFIISVENREIVKKIHIKDNFGQTVMKLHSANKYDISELEQGIYFIYIETENGSVSKKIIKQ